VPRPGEKDDVQIIFFDQAVEMDVGQAQTGGGAPMTEQALFDVLGFQRLTQQRVILQVDHPGR